MAEPVKEEHLGEALTALKKRSGRSFEALGRRLAVSKSALHRYASGEAIPARWDVVRAWAEECGATDEEIEELEGLWRRCVAEVPATAAEALPEPPVPAVRRAWLTWPAMAAVFAVVLVVGAGAYTWSAVAGSPAGGPCEKRIGVRHVDSRLAGHVWSVDFVCDNRDGTVLYSAADAARRVAVMETDRSWFVCWAPGATSTDVWYYTRGDRSEPGAEQEWDGWGFVSHDDVLVPVHPADGMPRCEFAP